ncbi:MAG: DNA polymerase III subunit chi, partial [Alphaproteobacteria bacterium]|nr:DNA polymerase III subunit chi [Alphaproteobacteria bacterium]
MADIHFYHMTRTALEQALPELLEKTLARSWRAVVMTGSTERAEALTQHLWTWKPNSFLPHGNARDGHAVDQPLWFTADDERPNEAEVLFMTDGAVSTHVADYMRVCMMFDGNDPD